jgi:hypothetical protein
VWEGYRRCMDTATGPQWEVHETCCCGQHSSWCLPSMSMAKSVGMVPQPGLVCVHAVCAEVLGMECWQLLQLFHPH